MSNVIHFNSPEERMRYLKGDFNEVILEKVEETAEIEQINVKNEKKSQKKASKSKKTAKKSKKEDEYGNNKAE